MTDEMKKAVRLMAAGRSAQELETIAEMQDEDVLVMLSNWAKQRISELEQNVSSYNTRIAEFNAEIDILKPFVIQTTTPTE